jgi:hypothetical protein
MPQAASYQFEAWVWQIEIFIKKNVIPHALVP